jgi:hypothetical protein
MQIQYEQKRAKLAKKKMINLFLPFSLLPSVQNVLNAFSTEGNEANEGMTKCN